MIEGLTWDHPRGFGPLERLTETDALLTSSFRPVEWSRQPLEGFESIPIAELADNFDLLVIDHPHIVDAVDASALIALDAVFAPQTLDGFELGTAGPSFTSYSYAGLQWALPIDAATQVQSTVPGVEPLETWAEVLEFAGAEATLLCLAGPHAFLNWLAIVLGMNCEPASSDVLVDRGSGEESMEFMIELSARCLPGFERHNPIAILESLDRSEARLCPLVYGYVNYANPSRRTPLVFRDAPAWSRGGRRGSVLGGTGIAISKRARPHIAELREQLARLMSAEVQEAVIPDAGGQPSSAAAWSSQNVNAISGNFYINTRATLDSAWVRPKLAGWPAFQNTASEIVRTVLARDINVRSGLDLIEAGFRKITSQGRP